MEQPQMNKPLDRAIAEEMITALHAINKIKNDPDRKPEPNDADQLEDLEIFLRQIFLDHASEFLGAWIAIATEYEPLVTSFAALQRRAASINGLKMQQQLGALQQQKSKIVPANIMPSRK